MNKNFKIILIILLALIFTKTESVLALEDSSIMNLKAESGVVNNEIILKDKYIKAKYASAENRFVQGNIKAAHDDYADLINVAEHDDYVLLAYAIKMAEYGFFDLTEKLFEKLDNNFYTKNYISDIRKFYYPSLTISTDNILYFSDAYASIVYNNMAIETTSELLNTNLSIDSDYKNYLISLGFYKSNNMQQALKYINNAIIQNSLNINYKILKAKILADKNKTQQTSKLLKEIQKNEFLTIDFQNKIKTAEEYILYKTAKEESLKDYHLAYYYHLQEKTSLAIKVLQGAVLQAKQYSTNIFGLLAKIYYEKDEPLKAQEFALRALKDNNKNYLATLTMADLAFDERKYEEALNYYKEAKKLTKEYLPTIGIAKTYLNLNRSEKSKNIYENLLKKKPNNEELLIGSLKIFPQKAEEYLPLVASMDVTNNEVWLGLADLAIKNSNYSMAQTYLNNSYYIDENNFKYYYYLSLLLKAKGKQAKQSLIKCSLLNSGYEEVLKLR